MASIDSQHTDMIHDVQLDYYGKRLASCSSDRSIKIFGVAGQEIIPRADILAHDGPVWQISWAHPRFGSWLASCGYDRKVLIHQEQSADVWGVLFSYDGATSSVNSISWGPHEYCAVLGCASADGNVYILSQQLDQQWFVETIKDNTLGVNSISWAPFGALGSVEVGPTGEQIQVRRFATGGCDNILRIYCLKDGYQTPTTPEFSYSGHGDWIRDVAWAPSLGLPVNTIASCSEDGLVLIWTQDAEGAPWTSVALPKFDKPVWRLSWSITGNVLAISSGDAEVSLWKETLSRKWVQVSTAAEPSAPATAQQTDSTSSSTSSSNVVPDMNHHDQQQVSGATTYVSENNIHEQQQQADPNQAPPISSQDAPEMQQQQMNQDYGAGGYYSGEGGGVAPEMYEGGISNQGINNSDGVQGGGMYNNEMQQQQEFYPPEGSNQQQFQDAYNGGYDQQQQHHGGHSGMPGSSFPEEIHQQQQQGMMKQQFDQQQQQVNSGGAMQGGGMMMMSQQPPPSIPLQQNSYQEQKPFPPQQPQMRMQPLIAQPTAGFPMAPPPGGNTGKPPMTGISQAPPPQQQQSFGGPAPQQQPGQAPPNRMMVPPSAGGQQGYWNQQPPSQNF